MGAPLGNRGFELSRFVETQAPIYARVIAELTAGRKQTHWMWFIFPQIAGLGHSAMARVYAIASLDEARAYMAHPVLGPRLLECTGLVLAVKDRTAREIFGTPDNLKFRSCMTLFNIAAPDRNEFNVALDRYFENQPDGFTMALLE